MGPENKAVPPVEDPQGAGFTTHHLDPKTSRATFQLPCGLVIEGKLVRDIQVSEMTGVEEELLAGKGPIGDRLNRVLANCLVDIGGLKGSLPLIMRLPMIDRLYMLIAIRRVSLGDQYMVRAKCPDEACKAEHDYSINLGTLPVVEMADPMVREFFGILPSGTPFSWHVMTGVDEEWVNAASKKLKGEGPLTIGILARLDSLAGEPLEKEPVKMRAAVQAVGKLGLRDRNFLRATFKKHEGDLDTNMEFTCQTCETEFESEIQVVAKDFFFPSET